VTLEVFGTYPAQTSNRRRTSGMRSRPEARLALEGFRMSTRLARAGA
jgi:hypothetical protein